ncbi:MAG: hypothetical protein ACLQI7_00825 [Streptosporangiaceae bacterium]
MDSQTDEEIEESFASVRERLAAITHTRTGKVMRFLVDGGAGAVPVVGPVLAPVVSLLDTFIVEELIGKPGPISFLGRSYPSIFIDGSDATR